MSPEAQIIHGAVFAPMLIFSFASMATDSDTWPLFAGVVSLAVVSFNLFSA